MTFRDRLISELTQLDARNAHKPRGVWNPYFLGLALNAVADTFDPMIAAGRTEADAFAATFTPTRETAAIARRLKLGLRVERGRWVMPGGALV